jgi:chromosome segregation ATPase
MSETTKEDRDNAVRKLPAREYDDGIYWGPLSVGFIRRLLQDADALEQAEAELATYKTAFFDAERAFGQAEVELEDAKSRLREVTELRDQDNENWRRDTRTLAEAEAERDAYQVSLAHAQDESKELRAQLAVQAELASGHWNSLKALESELVAVTEDRDTLVMATDQQSIREHGLKAKLKAYEAFADRCGTDGFDCAMAALRTELDKLKKQARGGE